MTNKNSGKHTDNYHAKRLGRLGEDVACKFLVEKGFQILEKNYRFPRIAEIDIIAKKNNTIHFIEVKTRSSLRCGAPLEAINKRKLMSIYKCARYYIASKNIPYYTVQIDAIGIIMSENGFGKNYPKSQTPSAQAPEANTRAGFKWNFLKLGKLKDKSDACNSKEDNAKALNPRAGADKIAKIEKIEFIENICLD